jgi:hypothetical protein
VIVQPVVKMLEVREREGLFARVHTEMKTKVGRKLSV